MSKVTKWVRGDGVALVDGPALAKIPTEHNLGIGIEPSPCADPSVEVQFRWLSLLSIRWSEAIFLAVERGVYSGSGMANDGGFQLRLERVARHPQSVDHVHVSGRVVDPPAGVLSEDVQDQQFVTPVVPRDHCSPICGAPLKAVRPVRPIVDSIRSVGIGSSALPTSPTLIGDAHFAQWVLQSGSDNFGRIACCEDLLSLVPGMEVTIVVINVWTCHIGIPPLVGHDSRTLAVNNNCSSSAGNKRCLQPRNFVRRPNLRRFSIEGFGCLGITSLGVEVVVNDDWCGSNTFLTPPGLPAAPYWGPPILAITRPYVSFAVNRLAQNLWPSPTEKSLASL
nr:uncharacterized protein LOC109189836 [Ipomoea batatas]